MCVWNEKCQFFPNRVVWRLGLATWLSRELTAWPDWKFCPVVLQLAWLFSSPACFTRVPPLATCQSRDLVARPCWVHTLEHFFTFSHTLPLHDSHLNIGFLNAELQKNWHRINLTKWLINFNLTKASSRKQKNTIFGSYCQYYCRYHTSHVVVMLVWSTPQLRRRK